MGELELGSLAEKANAEHRACEEAATTALSHAMNAGDLLTGAKVQLPHGGFGAWLEENFAGSGRTARAYMRVARHRDELEAQRQRSATLSLDGALKALSSEATADAPRRGSPATLEEQEAELGGALSEARAAALGVAEGLHEIYRGGGWVSLGYDSFAEYVTGEFAAIPYEVIADAAGEPLPLFAMAENINAWGTARVVDPLLREDV
jgi:hypothetical protein